MSQSHTISFRISNKNRSLGLITQPLSGGLIGGFNDAKLKANLPVNQGRGRRGWPHISHPMTYLSTTWDAGVCGLKQIQKYRNRF